MATSKVRIQPLGDRVLLKHNVEAEQMKGGIIIPDAAKEKPQEATVVALGTGRRDENGKLLDFHVKIGDVVLTNKYGGSEVSVDDQKYLLVREDDILAIIK